MYTEIKDGQVIVRVTESLNVRVAQEIELELNEALNMGEKRVIVDMSQTNYMDSTGLGVLVDIKERLDEIQGEMTLVGVHGYCFKVFKQVRLDEAFGLRENAS